jgi:hypothetical protein
MIYRIFLTLLFCIFMSSLRAGTCNFGLLREHADALNTRIWAGLKTSSQKVEGYLDFLQEEGGTAVPADSLTGLEAQKVKLEELLRNPIIVEKTEVSESLRSLATLCDTICGASENTLLKRKAAQMLLDATIEKVKNDLSVLQEARVILSPVTKQAATVPVAGRISLVLDSLFTVAVK